MPCCSPPARRRRRGADRRPVERRGTRRTAAATGRPAGPRTRGDAPNANSRRGWKDIFWRAYQEIQEDRLLAIAAGVVFFALLALFPAITAIVSIYGLFARPDTISGTYRPDLRRGAGTGGRRRRGADRPARCQQGGHARLRLCVRPCDRALERQCGHEGDHRRAERRL